MSSNTSATTKIGQQSADNTAGALRRHGSHSASTGVNNAAIRDNLRRQTQSSRGDRHKQSRLRLPPVTISHLDSDFELEGLAMRVPSPPIREEKKSTIHVRLVETGSNASHTEDLHSFCEMQLRDAKERESTWKKFRVSIEKQNLELKATIAQKDEELKAANQKIEELTTGYNAMERAYKGAQEEIESLKDKLARRVQRVDDMFLAHQKELASIKLEHQKELSARDEKLELLKSQLEKTMDEKSWERQKQLDELSRELGRVTEETETLKAALRTKTKPKTDEAS